MKFCSKYFYKIMSEISIFKTILHQNKQEKCICVDG